MRTVALVESEKTFSVPLDKRNTLNPIWEKGFERYNLSPDSLIGNRCVTLD